LSCSCLISDATVSFHHVCITPVLLVLSLLPPQHSHFVGTTLSCALLHLHHPHSVYILPLLPLPRTLTVTTGNDLCSVVVGLSNLTYQFPVLTVITISLSLHTARLSGEGSARLQTQCENGVVWSHFLMPTLLSPLSLAVRSRSSEM
jgi:hypothetical protein